MHIMSFRMKILTFALVILASSTFLILKGKWPIDKVGDTYTGINIAEDQSEDISRDKGPVDAVDFAVYDTPRDVPDVSFFGPDGRAFTFDNWRGQKLVVNFWATWCAPCVEELPRLNLLKQELDSRGTNVSVIAISMDTQKDFDDIAAFLKRHKAGKLTPFMDTNREVMRKMNLSGFPVTYILNEQGHEITRYEGPLAWDDPKVLDAILRL